MKTVMRAYFLLNGMLLLLYAELPHIASWAKAEDYPIPPELFAAHAILIEAGTRTVLYEKYADIPLAPASLTKLMTFYLSYEALGKGRIDIDAYCEVPPEASAERQEEGSSLMFLSEGEEVSIRDLLKGLMVSSGNDAAVALALCIDGNVARFVSRMNSTARNFGYVHMFFDDPSGLSALNRASAREWGDFAVYMLTTWPEISKEYFSLQSFTYPKKEYGFAQNPITQQNRNILLKQYEGADGVKTGYTEEAGYTLIASAERKSRRLVAVLLSVPASSHGEGGARRAQDAAALFDWGFEEFATTELAFAYPSLEIAGAAVRHIRLDPLGPTRYTLPRYFWEQLSARFRADASLQWAPIAEEQVLGQMTVEYKDIPLLVLPVGSKEYIARGSVVRRMGDAIRVLFGWRATLRELSP